MTPLRYALATRRGVWPDEVLDSLTFFSARRGPSTRVTGHINIIRIYPDRAAPLVLDSPRKEVTMPDYGDRREPNPTVGPLLHLARTKAGLTQSELAEKSGLSMSLISKVENGKRDLGRSSLSKLVGVLGWEFGRSVLKSQKEA